MQNIDPQGLSLSHLPYATKFASGQFCPLAVFSCQKEHRNWTTGFLLYALPRLCP